ncbi:hypothetical protein EJB05_21361 [Eragrostis curvula]|uniref:Uncharacterized protein n=1 Tax=Eragrostis curvula TaxID=38414 RepID=A0A5J9V1I5_9POAL|nr:hypothetical protein EJB05_21361 [Eragrostis curvula]
MAALLLICDRRDALFSGGSNICIQNVWRALFGGREDFEKRLQYLSKEDATVHARMHRRTQFSRCSILAEVNFDAKTVYDMIRNLKDSSECVQQAAHKKVVITKLIKKFKMTGDE